MPKFISNSSGAVYAPDKLKKDDDEILASLESQDGTSDAKKPSAVNKRGTKEKQKSSLDLFKEELKRLDEEQKNKLKNSSNDTQSRSPQQKPQALIPVPLLPDPRCPTSLTLQVNLNPRDKDTSTSGSFDTGDPTTTNLYIGNLNPTVTENDLCDIFGRFGPLASIKIMWPRTDEERARKRNSGFVAYMSRIDGERALKVLNGIEFRGYDMKLGWGKAVPIPKNPVFIPAELLKSLQPPPKSGLPFNAQLHTDDIESGYMVPNPIPKHVPLEFISQTESEAILKQKDKDFHEFLQVLQRSTVQVHIPQDRSLLDRIHKTIEFVIREGPVFESIITARESSNPDYQFFREYESPEHIYYRWKLYSILHGDDPYAWSTNEFRMYEGGPLWRPPPLNPFADGMPIDLVEKLTGISRDELEGSAAVNPRKLMNFTGESNKLSSDNDLGSRSKLNPVDLKTIGDILKDLEPTKTSVGSAMLFCIKHSYAAEEIIDCISDSISTAAAPIQRHLAQLFLISDILNNSSAAVTNASYYRQGFKERLKDVFAQLRVQIVRIGDDQLVKKLRQKIINVLDAWKYYQLYEEEFVLELNKTLFDSTTDQHNDISASAGCSFDAIASVREGLTDEQLDGEPIDDATLAECLEKKGLSLRWYMTLELSDDEEEDFKTRTRDDVRNGSPEVVANHMNSTDSAGEIPETEMTKKRFKVSKWELITNELEKSESILNKPVLLSKSAPESCATLSSADKELKVKFSDKAQ